MVAFQSMSRGRGRRVRVARLSAPVTAARVRLAIRRSISATTFPTTSRAVRRGRLRHHLVEADQGADQVDVGLHRVQQLGLEQHRGQVEPLDRVPLHHLHHAGREVGADVAQPAGHPRRRRAEPAALPRAGSPSVSPARRAQPAPGPSPARRGSATPERLLGRLAEQQPPAASSLISDHSVGHRATAQDQLARSPSAIAARVRSSSSPTASQLVDRSAGRDPAGQMVRRSAGLKVPNVRRTSGNRSTNSARPARRPNRRAARAARGRGSAAARRRRRTRPPRRPWRRASTPWDSARSTRTGDIVEPLGIAAAAGPSGRAAARHVGAVDQRGQRGQPLPAEVVTAVRPVGGRRLGRVSSPTAPLTRSIRRRMHDRARPRPGRRRPAAGRRRSARTSTSAHLAQGRGVGAAHVAVALRPGQRRQRIHQVHDVGVQRRPVGQRVAAAGPARSGRSASRQRSTARVSSEQAALLARSAPTRAVAADSTVVPHTAASTTATESSGSPAGLPRSRGRCPGSAIVALGRLHPVELRAAGAGGTAATGAWSMGRRRSRS